MLILGNKNACNQLEGFFHNIKFKRRYRDEIKLNILDFVRNNINIYMNNLNSQGIDLIDDVNSYIVQNFSFTDSNLVLNSFYGIKDEFLLNNKENIFNSINPDYYFVLEEHPFLLEENINEAYYCLIFMALESLKYQEIPGELYNIERIKTLFEEYLTVKIPSDFNDIFDTKEKCLQIQLPLYSLPNFFFNKKYAFNKLKYKTRKNAYVRDVLSLRKKILLQKKDFHLTEENEENFIRVYSDLHIYHEYSNLEHLRNLKDFLIFVINHLDFEKLLIEKNKRG